MDGKEELMEGYPNQLKIVVQKSPTDKKRGFNITDNIDEEIASELLNAGAFKLWRYCSRNADGYSFWLSPKAISRHMKKDQYYKAKQELIGVGYLVPIREGSNIYIFRERLEGFENGLQDS